MSGPIYFPVSTLNKGRVIILKADNFMCGTVSIDDLKNSKLSHFNVETLKYSEKESSLQPSNKAVKVLVYNDGKNGLYGIVNIKTKTNGAVSNSLTWVPKCIIDNPDESTKEALSRILNTHNTKNLLNIDEHFKFNYKASKAYNGSKVRAYCMLSEHNANLKLLTVEEIEELIANKNNIEFIRNFHKKSEPEQVEDKAGQVENSAEHNIEEVEQVVEKEEHVVDGVATPVEEAKALEKTEHAEEDVEAPVENLTFLQNTIADIVKRELLLQEKVNNLAKLEEELRNKERILNLREEELNEREYYLVRESQEDTGIDVVDAKVLVDNTVDVCENTVCKESKFLYDTLLKVAKYGDRLTVPFEVYKQFNIVLKSRALDRNSDYTVFTQLVQLKTDMSQTAGIIAVVEVDNENPVKITVVKEYGTQKFETHMIQRFENDYRQWRRDRSYLM